MGMRIMGLRNRDRLSVMKHVRWIPVLLHGNEIARVPAKIIEVVKPKSLIEVPVVMRAKVAVRIIRIAAIDNPSGVFGGVRCSAAGRVGLLIDLTHPAKVRILLPRVSALLAFTHLRGVIPIRLELQFE